MQRRDFIGLVAVAAVWSHRARAQQPSAAEGRYDRLPALAADLVDRRVNVIFTGGSTPATLAAKGATTTIPIVFFVGGDPVELGLVNSLTRPGGNLTGVTNLTGEIAVKRVELLHELLPSGTTFGLLVNPTSPAQARRSCKLCRRQPANSVCSCTSCLQAPKTKLSAHLRN
jgi:putative ABC transport system substrate-binding protein